MDASFSVLSRLTTFPDANDQGPRLAALGCVLTSTGRVHCAFCCVDNGHLSEDIILHVRHEHGCRLVARRQRPAVVAPRREVRVVRVYDVIMGVTLRVRTVRGVQDYREGVSRLAVG